MINKVCVDLFRFNKNTDYLPYYTKYILDYKSEDKVSTLLDSMNKIQAFGCENIENCYIKINNLYLHSSENLQDVIAEVGTDLIIEPISTKRAVHDLVIDTSDYSDKLSKLDKFLTPEDIQHYVGQYLLEYYASNSLSFNSDYIGDHVLLIASDLIEKNPDSKDEILEILNDENTGAVYHTALDNRIFQYCSSKQEKLKSLIESKIINSQIINSDDITVSQEFRGFNIASYDGVVKNDTIKNLIEKSNATYINCISKNDDLALQALELNKTFTYQIAGNILLEAKDRNADFIVVPAECLAIFDGKQQEIEKAVGRDINLSVVTTEQFIQLLNNEKDIKTLGFDKHTTPITFL